MSRPQAPTSLIFRNTQAPGDVLMMTAAIRDLHRCYPGRFVTNVETTAGDIWMHNPYLQAVNKKHASTIRLGYPLIQKSNQWGIHFIQGFIRDLNQKQNLNIRLTEFRGDLYFSEEELANPPVQGDYWVMLSGGKSDFTTKWWDPTRYQDVVNRLQGKVAFVQIGNKPDGGGAPHFHPPMSGVVNLVGKTSLRQALVIIKHARGVLCPITFAMHAAAAMCKPCVVIAGGREHYTWEAYTEETLRRNMAWAKGIIKKPPGTPDQWNSWSPHSDDKFVNHVFVPHRYHHSIGELKCCRNGGCWKPKVTEGKPEENCQDVVRRVGRQALPKCMDLITVDSVVQDILEYEEQLDAAGEQGMATVQDLIVNVDGGNEPPPTQKPSPVVDNPNVVKETPVSSNGHPIAPGSLKFNHLKFPITVCALTYGDHGDLAVRCLNSLYACMHPSLFRLRIGMNAPSKKARKQILAFVEEKANLEKMYEADPQVYKYPMMRAMFHDTDKPIETDWIMWLDDDSHIVDANFITALGNKVDEKFLDQTEQYPKGHHCFGKVYYFHFRGDQIASTRKDQQAGWVEEADWFEDRPYPLDRTKRPPMPKSDFCTGGYWLVTRQAIQDCNWPDVRLKHRGGDIMLGAALHQQGYGVSQIHEGVKISHATKRGYDEAIAGTK